jgi:hypothetical protein
LLSKPPADWLEYLTSYNPQNPLGPSREGLLRNVTQAAGQSFDWGLKLAEALAAGDQWSSDLWQPILGGWPAGADPCSLGSAISRRDLWELAAHFSQPVKRHAAGEYTLENALPEESPFGRSQTLKSHRLRPPIATSKKEGRLRSLGFSREAPMAPSVARGSTLHCKPD